MNKKEEVIDAARKLFSIFGFKKVSMDEIARESGVSKKTIYSYFKDKDSLIKYFLYQNISKMKDMILKIDQMDLHLSEKVHKIIYSLLEFRKEDRLIRKFVIEAKDFPSSVASECMDILNNSLINEIKSLLIKGIENGEVKECNTDLAAFLIFKLYGAIMFEWDRPLDEKEVTENIMKLLKTGIFI